VRSDDGRINQTEIEIEEECLRLLALQQPVAMDLRFIVSVFKINNDLERIGDVAANIARRAAALSDGPHMRPPAGVDFAPMAQHAQKMLRQALDALVNGDNKLAMAVCAEDEWMDEANRRMQSAIEDEMRIRPDAVNRLAQLLSVSRHLERIADLSTNIAEDVIYMLEGVIVRHRFDAYRKQQEMRV
jgi:phosphate transport system protein